MAGRACQSCSLVLTVRDGVVDVDGVVRQLVAEGLRLHETAARAGYHWLRLAGLSQPDLEDARARAEEVFGSSILTCADSRTAVRTGGLVRVEPRLRATGRGGSAVLVDPGEPALAGQGAARSPDREATVAVVGQRARSDPPGSCPPGELDALDALLRRLCGVNAVPVSLPRGGVTATAEALARLAPRFQAIVLVGGEAPRCFAMARHLRERLAIPVLEQHQGLAAAVAGALLGCLRTKDVSAERARVVVNGADAAGTVIAHALVRLGVGEVLVVDRGHVLVAGEVRGRAVHHLELAAQTNRLRVRGGLGEALSGAHGFVDLAGSPSQLRDVAFAMAAVPTLVLLSPDHADDQAEQAPRDAVVATCLPYRPNFVDAILALPGMVAAALDPVEGGAGEHALDAAAIALGAMTSAEGLLPDVFDPRLVPAVSEAVKTWRGADAAENRTAMSTPVPGCPVSSPRGAA